MENQNSMKQLALAIAVVLAMGCGFGCSQAPEEMLGKQSASLQTAAPLCAPVELVAEKSYSPSSWADATEWLDTQRAFLLPASVDVIEGLSGNHWVTFTWKNPAGSGGQCRYKGASSQAHPVGPTQTALAQKYVFDSCTSGARPGTEIVADFVKLHVDNGDSYQPRTEVRAQLEEVSPCVSRGVSRRIPALPFPSYGASEFAPHPTFGLEIGKRHLLLSLKDDANMDDIRAIEGLSGGRIVGAISEVALVVLEFPWEEDFAALAEAQAAIGSHPAVSAVSYDMLLQESAVPRPRTYPAPSPGLPWTWGGADRPGTTGNWGLRYIRAPLAWNANAALRKRAASVPVIVVDSGFQRHEDLQGILTLAKQVTFDQGGNLVVSPGVYQDNDPVVAETSHGTATAGIIGARWGNGRYIDGVTPFATITGAGVISQLKPVQLAGMVDTMVRAALDPQSSSRVVNISLSLNLGKQCFDSTGALTRPGNIAGQYRCDPGLITETDGPHPSSTCDAAALRASIEKAGKAFADAVAALQTFNKKPRPVLFVVGAGNDSGPEELQGCIAGTPRGGLGDFPAHWSSPMAYAAIKIPAVAPHMIVAESIGPKNEPGISVPVLRRSSFSNLVTVPGRGLFAPGEKIQSLAGGGSLSTVQDESGTSFSAPMVVGAAAFIAAAKPELTNQQVRKILVDEGAPFPKLVVSSQTDRALDLARSLRAVDKVAGGNTIGRMLADMNDATRDGFTRVAYGPAFSHVTATGTKADVASFTEESDGIVDMRDFRRLRDLLLASNGRTIIQDVTNPSTNPALDLNGDGLISSHPETARARK
ncbi:MAG: S8 family serine peptidase [Polyangiaceae bacterium]|nr:S8 family serine peptidase [Polyangiaceae bacterium]